MNQRTRNFRLRVLVAYPYFDYAAVQMPERIGENDRDSSYGFSNAFVSQEV